MAIETEEETILGDPGMMMLLVVGILLDPEAEAEAEDEEEAVFFRLVMKLKLKIFLNPKGPLIVQEAL